MVWILKNAEIVIAQSGSKHAELLLQTAAQARAEGRESGIAEGGGLIKVGIVRGSAQKRGWWSRGKQTAILALVSYGDQVKFAWTDASSLEEFGLSKELQQTVAKLLAASHIHPGVLPSLS